MLIRNVGFDRMGIPPWTIHYEVVGPVVREGLLHPRVVGVNSVILHDLTALESCQNREGGVEVSGEVGRLVVSIARNRIDNRVNEMVLDWE